MGPLPVEISSRGGSAAETTHSEMLLKGDDAHRVAVGGRRPVETVRDASTAEDAQVGGRCWHYGVRCCR